MHCQMARITNILTYHVFSVDLAQYLRIYMGQLKESDYIFGKC